MAGIFNGSCGKEPFTGGKSMLVVCWAHGALPVRARCGPFGGYMGGKPDFGQLQGAHILKGRNVPEGRDRSQDILWLRAKPRSGPEGGGGEGVGRL